MPGKQFQLSVLLTAIDRITGPVQRIRATLARATAPARDVGNKLAALRAETRGLAVDLGLQRLRESSMGVVTAIQAIGTAGQTSARRLGLLTAAAGGVSFLFKREFIDTASFFENLETSLESIEGSRDRAREAMAFIQDLTIKTPFAMQEIAQSFRVLRGFGMDPRANNTLNAIIEQVAKIGGKGEDLSAIAMQLGQAFSKGRLQAQDANILVERGVPVWALLQHAVERVNKGQKVTIGQLRTMSEAGQLGPRAILALIEQMGIEGAGASKRMMGTWTGLTSNLSDQWTLFKKRVMDTGEFRQIKNAVADILRQIDVLTHNGELQAWADRIGAGLRDGFTWLRSEGPGILRQITDNMKFVFGVANQVATALGGWGNFIGLGLAAYIGGPLVTAFASLVGAIGSLNLALLGTPAGWFLLAGAGLIAAVGGSVWAWKQQTQAGPTYQPPRHGIKVSDFADPMSRARAALGPMPLGSRQGPPAVTEAARAAAGSASPAQWAAQMRDLLEAGRSHARPPEARVTIDVNAPPGTTVRQVPQRGVDLTIRRGLTMAESH